MATMIRDSIDFSGYMEDTDAAHKVRSTADFTDEVIAHFHNPEDQKGQFLPWHKTRNLFRFRPGEVTLWNGMNGHGKSLAMGMVCMSLVAQRQQVCIASMEMKPAVTLARICRQAHMNPMPSPEFIRDFHDSTNRRLWLYDQQGTVKADKMLAVVRYCADKLKVSHFVIDSLMKMGIPEDDYTRQKQFVDSLTATARDYSIHIHLVAHAKKGPDESKAPGKYDVKGSGAITDQVDNVLTVWRNKAKERAMAEGRPHELRDPDALLICDKQRNGEWEGRVSLWFDPASQQFMESGICGPMDFFKVMS